MRLISDRVYSARLTAKVLLYQKMTFIFHEQLTFLNLPIPFFPHSPLHVHSSLYPIWFPSKRNHQRPMNIFKMSPERVALLLGRRLTATVHPAESHFRVGGRVGGEEAASLRPKSISIARPLKKHSALKSSSNTYHSQTIIPPNPSFPVAFGCSDCRLVFYGERTLEIWLLWAKSIFFLSCLLC